MNFLIRIFCCILLFSLYGCASKNALRGQALAQCQMSCMKHFDFCSQNCVDNCPTCSRKSQQHSAANFSKYVTERKVQGKKVMRELNSYRDPLQCRKVTCNCVADLMACKQSCSGVIHKRLQALPNCV
jgi:hypothetical protein